MTGRRAFSPPSPKARADARLQIARVRLQLLPSRAGYIDGVWTDLEALATIRAGLESEVTAREAEVEEQLRLLDPLVDADFDHPPPG